MERIKKALERARREREALSATGEDSSRAAKRVPHGARGAPAEPKVSPPSEFTFSQTRVVQVGQRSLERHRLIAGLQSDAIDDAYRLLRTRVLQHMRRNDWKTLGVTSAGQGEGKTLTAINLAISLARDVNYTVLLCDLDLRNPSVHKYFDQSGYRGLSDYLLGDVDLPEILFNPGVPRLVVLPGNEAVKSSSEALTSPKMVTLVEEMTARYPSRLLVFDLPPLAAADNVLAFSPHVDAMLLVVQAGKTSRESVRLATSMLGTTPLIGTVLNRANEPVASTYY